MTLEDKMTRQGFEEKFNVHPGDLVAVTFKQDAAVGRWSCTLTGLYYPDMDKPDTIGRVSPMQSWGGRSWNTEAARGPDVIYGDVANVTILMDREIYASTVIVPQFGQAAAGNYLRQANESGFRRI